MTANDSTFTQAPSTLATSTHATSTHATVIGARGYVGAHLVERLQSRGLVVVSPLRGEEGQLTGCDLGDLYYCAGLTVDYARDPVATAEAHIGLLGRLLQSCRYKRVVYLSSTRLYDAIAAPRVDETTCLPLEPLRPRHLYDLTKAAGESLCLALAGERARILRLSCIWSQEPTAQGFLPDLLRQLKASPTGPDAPPLVLCSHPHLARHYCHLDELLDAMEASVASGCDPIVHLASDERPTTNGELLAFLERRCGVRFHLQGHEGVAPPSPTPQLDLSRCRALLGRDPTPLLSMLDSLLPALTPGLDR
jgi:UDP-glucose 4-epimerase